MDRYITALEKVIGHSGIRFEDALTLQKSNFNLENNTISIQNKKTTKIQIATIRPDDVEWFADFFKDEEEGIIFSFAPRTIRYYLKRKNTSPHILRKDLWDTMQHLKAPDAIIAIKFGHWIDFEDEPFEKNKLFAKLREFENIHFGGIAA